MTLNQDSVSKGDVLFLAVGELLVSLLTVGGFFLFDAWDFRVLVGVLVGALVSVLNFLMLSFTVSRAVKRVMAERGDREMTDEEAAVFAAAHTGEIQKSVRSSYIIRQTLLLLILVIPLIFKVANVLAAAIPLLLFRPILMVREAFRNKKTKKGA